MVREAANVKDRHSNDAKSSVRAPAKKEGGGGRYTLGKVGDYGGGATVEYDDPNFDPDERRVDPDDGTAYKYDELAAFYKGKFTAQAIAEYWEYECTAVKRKGKKAAAAGPAGPSLAESAAQAKVKAKKAPVARDPDSDTLQKEVADIIPIGQDYPSVQGLLNHPNLFNAVCGVMAKRFRKLGITKIAAFEPRGYLFSPVAIKLGKPFVILSKQGEVMQPGAIAKGDKVAMLDDWLAEGAVAGDSISFIKQCEAEVLECACLVEVTALGGRDKCLQAGAKDVWSFVSEDLVNGK